jgi:hypothetical protein
LADSAIQPIRSMSTAALSSRNFVEELQEIEVHASHFTPKMF